MASITVSNLTKTYRNSGIQALAGVSFSIEAGEIFGLLGPNGAGKTTTLSILCGVLGATSGAIFINGEKTNHRRLAEIIGFVPQTLALYDSLTTRENLYFFGRIHGLNRKLLKRRVDECLETAGLSDSADRLVSTFSGGMKRRANLVAALIHHPSIIILDEPTVGIDAQSRNAIIERLRTINSTWKSTIIYATHYMEEAEQLCSRVAVIDHGMVIKTGEPEKLIAERSDCRNLEELFLSLTGRSLRD